jgi:hypothetical protein
LCCPYFASRADRTLMDEGLPAVANKCAELWASMRVLKTAAIPDDPELAADLAGVEYGYNARSEIPLERKKDMKKRGTPHPTSAMRWCSPSPADLAHDDDAGPPEVIMMKDDWEPYRDVDDPPKASCLTLSPLAPLPLSACS